MDPRIPDKQYFRIGEVARIAGVETSVLRFWETEFPSLRPEKNRANQRMYSREDAELVLRIRDLLYEEGYTIAGARRQLGRGRGAGQAARRGDRTELPARTRALFEQIRNEVRELLQLVDE
ncbi:MAG: MerR family transcriptional regulator [Proteobacteria bacterium]|nr:MerR family transcriptional regulator [Pseudomonadota bacterium]